MPEEERLTLLIKVCTLEELRTPIPLASFFSKFVLLSAILKHFLAIMAASLSLHYWWHLDLYMPGIP